MAPGEGGWLGGSPGLPACTPLSACTGRPSSLGASPFSLPVMCSLLGQCKAKLLGTTMVGSPAKTALFSRARGKEMLSDGLPFTPHAHSTEMPLQGRRQAGERAAAGIGSGNDPEQCPIFLGANGGHRGERADPRVQLLLPPEEDAQPGSVRSRGCIQQVGCWRAWELLLPAPPTQHLPQAGSGNSISGSQFLVVSSISQTLRFSKTLSH